MLVVVVVVYLLFRALGVLLRLLYCNSLHLNEKHAMHVLKKVLKTRTKKANGFRLFRTLKYSLHTGIQNTQTLKPIWRE
jgi:hypothetical protein